MNIIIERLYPGVQLPTKGSQYAAGFDLYCPRDYLLLPGVINTIPLGFKTTIDNNYFAKILDRSSLASKGIQILGGTIDPDYRDEWLLKIINNAKEEYSIDKGHRIAQFVILPIETVNIIEGSVIKEETNDRQGGFGSTGQ